jgi:hypothetical protein
MMACEFRTEVGDAVSTVRLTTSSRLGLSPFLLEKLIARLRELDQKK